jgi:hypothetical protein
VRPSACAAQGSNLCTHWQWAWVVPFSGAPLTWCACVHTWQCTVDGVCRARYFRRWSGARLNSSLVGHQPPLCCDTRAVGRDAAGTASRRHWLPGEEVVELWLSLSRRLLTGQSGQANPHASWFRLDHQRRCRHAVPAGAARVVTWMVDPWQIIDSSGSEDLMIDYRNTRLEREGHGSESKAGFYLY